MSLWNPGASPGLWWDGHCPLCPPSLHFPTTASAPAPASALLKPSSCKGCSKDNLLSREQALSAPVHIPVAQGAACGSIRDAQLRKPLCLLLCILPLGFSVHHRVLIPKGQKVNCKEQEEREVGGVNRAQGCPDTRSR